MAPSERRNPISARRSRTEITIVFATPTPPTSNATAPSPSSSPVTASPATSHPTSAPESSSGASGAGSRMPTTVNQRPPISTSMSGPARLIPSRAAASEPSVSGIRSVR
ncbi:hypothetical protein GCM10027445_50660 [Amycolatopsis endophytica]|uniref:Uncharacterized protein n=1 Tax=Amycolatopsis endophytica TaxID=860233 RepID=A0A853AYT1_9PSEU|nr:hypothetical protein [Amycolatopsis endophytica]